MSLIIRPEGGDSGLRGDASGLRSGGGYEPPESVQEQGFLVAEVISPTESLVSFDKTQVPAHSSGPDWLELTLTRNPAGAPVTNLDGQVVGRYGPDAIVGWQTYRDRLRPGREMHYGLFARYNAGGHMQWLRVATTSVLAPDLFDYASRLYSKIPEWYRIADYDTTDRLMLRMMKAVGMEVDITRTWVETLGHARDPEKAPAVLLPYMSEVLGLPYERTVGDARVRKLLSSLIYLRKTKGTKDSIEGYLSALSGYRILAHQSPNIMLTVEDGEFRSGTGSWAAGDDSDISRVTSGSGGAPPAPLGLLQIERTGSTGVAEAVSADDSSPTNLAVLEPGESREYAVSLNARTSTGSFNIIVSLDWYDVEGTFISSISSAGLGTSTTFGRKLTAWMAAPDTARYVRMRITTGSIAEATSAQVGQIMLVDRRWRPEGIPGYVNAEPFSESGSTNYTGYDFYDSPRTVWLNVYPQRTNFAVNSRFTLDNLPADGWSVAEMPTYGGMPFAYEDYAEVAEEESDYADLAADFNTLTPTWTIDFDTANERLVMISSDDAPYMSQVRSKSWPVLPGMAYSAAIEMSSDNLGTHANFSIQWMTKNDPFSPLLDDGGQPIITTGPVYELHTDYNIRVEIRNVIAPEGAGYGRLIVQSTADVAHETYLQRALIEDAPVPGAYFDGNVVDGALGDFGFTGVAFQSPSVYYLNYTAVLGSSSNRILTASRDILPMHVNEARLISAYDGLYES